MDTDAFVVFIVTFIVLDYRTLSFVVRRTTAAESCENGTGAS